MNEAKTLLIIVTGSGKDYWSEHSRFEPFKKEDNVDVAICFWGENEYSDQFWKSAKYIHRQKGNKFHLIRDFFAKNPQIIDEYEYFWFMDDDMYMTRADFLTFMEIFKVFNFDLACPGIISKGDGGSSRFSRRRASIFRTLNTVDINAFCVSKRAFLAVLPLFNASPYGHGWGIPEWWLEKYHHDRGRSIHGGRIGCIDASPAEHTRKKLVASKDLGGKFGSQKDELKFYEAEFIGRSVYFWLEIKQYEYITGEKLKKAIAASGGAA